MTGEWGGWGGELFPCQQIGEGRLLHCWKQRISRDRSIGDGDMCKCMCGNIIGSDAGRKTSSNGDSLSTPEYVGGDPAIAKGRMKKMAEVM